MENCRKLMFFLLTFYIYYYAKAQNSISGVNSGLLYLAKYGYLDPSVANPENGALLNEESLNNAIKEFQDFAGLNVTGELDSETIRMMNTPRCGVKDKVGYGSNARKKRYALQGSRWKVKKLTYRITKYPPSLSKKEVDIDVEKAFKVWEDVTDLTFTKSTSGKMHIDIRFERGEHGDGDAFDGRGGTLAHAYFPIYGGDAHFDAAERWTVNKYSGTNLFQVASHEFGHSLGLSHSDVDSSLMAPFYKGYERNFRLDIDDITAIQALYGEKEVRRTGDRTTPSPAAPPSPSVPRKDSELCGKGFDAIANVKGETHVFKGYQYWKLTKEAVAKGYPKRIASKFLGLPGNLDAAFTWTNNKTYYFKGSQYYRFKEALMDEGYPKAISTGFKGIPNNIDLAFVWGGNGKIYFFKNRLYWKFDPAKRPPVSDRYPKDISIWEGLPYRMDAALKYINGYTYFFKDGKYWRFNDRLFAVDEDRSEPYPRDAGYWWFGCPSKGDMAVIPNANESPSDYGDVVDDPFNGEAGADTNYIYDDNYIHPRSKSFLKSDAGSLAINFTYFLVPILSKMFF